MTERKKRRTSISRSVRTYFYVTLANSNEPDEEKIRYDFDDYSEFSRKNRLNRVLTKHSFMRNINVLKEERKLKED